MAIVKGISKEITSEELITVMLSQNVELALEPSVLLWTWEGSGSITNASMSRSSPPSYNVIRVCSLDKHRNTAKHPLNAAHTARRRAESLAECKARDSAPVCYNCKAHNTRLPSNTFTTQHKASGP
ncbi:unnamed protein product [Euphydryas editha]|uniref:Uncharacterized protein n=1 Tax=Euphydryas editha TaxID=104508 RepID=A0AAU9TSM6_EUPED|nr:unnamed protein product [Euphydryas editha]